VNPERVMTILHAMFMLEDSKHKCNTHIMYVVSLEHKVMTRERRESAQEAIRRRREI